MSAAESADSATPAPQYRLTPSSWTLGITAALVVIYGIPRHYFAADTLGLVLAVVVPLTLGLLWQNRSALSAGFGGIRRRGAKPR